MQGAALKIQLTGNPFVDTGLGVIASLANLDDIAELTVGHVQRVYSDGPQLSEWNSKLKAFTQVFGTNNPLFQTAYGYKKGKGPSDTNVAIYKGILEGLLSEIVEPVSATTSRARCWACGNPSHLDFALICKNAIEASGKNAPEDKWIGRDWFPLAGSLGSDAQALPAASKPPTICATCLFSVHYLPLGLMLVEGRLTVFQATSIEFWYEFVRDIVGEIRGRIHASNYETLGSKKGGRAVMQRLLSLLERLYKEQNYSGVSEGIALYAWQFSNSGASAACQIGEIPNRALTFLREAVQQGLRFEIEGLIAAEGKNPRFSLYQSLLDGRDYPSLYPEGKKMGGSIKLFVLYQTDIRNHSLSSLRAAYILARKMSEMITAKELKRIQRPEAFKEARVRNQFKAVMSNMAERGEFTLEAYLDLFPLLEGETIRIDRNGWKLIRFFLNANEDFPKVEERDYVASSPDQLLVYCAERIYNCYLDERGKTWFAKNVLAQMDRRSGLPWLRNQFVRLAETNAGFSYASWARLANPEALFQMRLLWATWSSCAQTPTSIIVPGDQEPGHELSAKVRALIQSLFTDYVARRGFDRFHRDILLRLRRRELGLFWFKKKLMGPTSEEVEPLSEDEWERFLIDDEGQSIKTERLFQLHLALANLYRTHNSLS